MPSLARSVLELDYRPQPLATNQSFRGGEPVQQCEVDQLPDPRFCQSCNRRQQDMPEPQPSSCGSISQGTPLRNTTTMPARHPRYAKRGLPPLGFALGIG